MNISQKNSILEDAEKYEPSHTHILAIAIDVYRKPTPEEVQNGFRKCTDLHCCVSDARAFIEAMVQCFGICREQIYSLYNEMATRKVILKTMGELRDRLTSKHNLIVYFSGHGEERKPSNVGYIIPHDALNGEEVDYINNSTLHDIIKEMKVRHLLIISDSCYSASLVKRNASGFRNLEADYHGDEHRSYQKPSRWLLASGDEPVPDGSETGHSPFMTRLLQYFRGGDENVFSVYQLGAYLIEKGNLDPEPICVPFDTFLGHQIGGQMWFSRVSVAPVHKTPDDLEMVLDEIEQLQFEELKKILKSDLDVGRDETTNSGI